MKTATLTRDFALSDPDGTFGNLVVDGVVFATVELPWHDNEPYRSCVPPGTYLCKSKPSRMNLNAGLDVAYEVIDVTKRTAIKIHVANWPRELLGCIGLGMSRAFVGGRHMVVESVPAIKKFHALMNNEDFILVIQ